MDFSQRCSYADRDDAVKALSEHHGAGRIDFSEFDERSTAALSAKTYADLRALFLDLPDPRPSWLESLLPAEIPAPAPAVREEAPAPAKQVRPKWVSAAQTLVWPAIFIPWLGFGIGGWWLIFVAIAFNVVLEVIFDEDDDKPEIESGQ